MEALIRWYLTIALISAIFGNLSSIVSMRRLYFLAAAAPHSSLLAVSIAVVLTNITRALNEYVWSSIVGCLLLLLIGYTIYRGFDVDVITSIYVALSASFSILIMNYVLANYRLGYNMWAVILGDPLLVTWEEVFMLLIIALITPIVVAYSFRYQLYMGIDPDYIKANVRHRWAYELITFALLGLTSAALIRVTGFVLQHILILLPSIVAINLSESARKAYTMGLLISLAVGMTGFQIALLTNTAPSGTIGLMMVVAYAASTIRSRFRRA